MMRPTIPGIIKTSIVTAFTIAAALIWKDVIIETIELLVPTGGALFYKLFAAVLSTVLVVIALYVILKTESEAEAAIKKLKGNRLKHKK